MHHKKIFATIALGLVTAVLSLSNPANAANLNQAVNTLPQNEEWSIMARAAIGQNSGQTFLRSPISNGSATDYEKRILAITALDENPRTFGSENFVEKLESFFDGNQIGDSSLLNDDIFGVLALTSAGISNNTVSKSRQFILSHQNSDGGCGLLPAWDPIRTLLPWRWRHFSKPAAYPIRHLIISAVLRILPAVMLLYQIRPRMAPQQLG